MPSYWLRLAWRDDSPMCLLTLCFLSVREHESISICLHMSIGGIFLQFHRRKTLPEPVQQDAADESKEALQALIRRGVATSMKLALKLPVARLNDFLRATKRHPLLSRRRRMLYF